MSAPRYQLASFVKIAFETPSDFSHFFGYYNYSPLSADGRSLLCHRVDFDGRDIKENDVAEVGWFGLKTGVWHLLGKTRAFNWQQGAMLQWLGPDFQKQVAYNDVEDNHFVTRIVSVDENPVRTLPYPVYGITPDGKQSITLEFERSYWCRAYHYESVRNPKWNVPVPLEDGVFLVDIESGVRRRIISLQQVMDFDRQECFDEKSHWIEHIMLNPSGKRFAFYHRFGQGHEFQTRVLTAGLDGRSIFLCPGWTDNQCSHLGWKNDKEFVLFSYKKALVGRIHAVVQKRRGVGQRVLRYWRQFMKPWVPQRVRTGLMVNTSYQLFQDCYGPIGRYSKGRLSTDGHPSFTSDGRFMLTDTYADRDGNRHLLLYDTRSEKLYELGRFYSPFNNCGYRCDLHPRFSRDEQSVIIDTAHSGKHQVLMLEIKWNLLGCTPA